MRMFSGSALLGVAAIAAAPAAAQVSSPGPVYYNQSGAPIPGAPYDAPRVGSPGPVYSNAPDIPPPSAVWSRREPDYDAPPPMVSADPPYRTGPERRGDRWGDSVNGRWWGGSRAPGGWGAYRRPRRGGALPGYWMSRDFQIPDYGSYGLNAPPHGYFWVRYYDDAVLVDARGGVWDSVSGIAWAGASASAGGGYGYAASSASASAGAGGRGGIRTVDPDQYYERDGEPWGGYAPPVGMGPPAVHVQGGGCPCPPQAQYGRGYGYQQGGHGQNGYHSGGGYYAGGTTTTIVIQPGATVTTTIVEEVIEEEEVVTTTSYASRPTKRVYRTPAPAPRKYRTKTKLVPRY